MSLLRHVAELVRERGSGSIDDLLPTLAEFGFTRLQVGRALHNAQNAGLIYCVGRKSRRGTPRGNPCASTYYPVPEDSMTLIAKAIAKPEKPVPMLVSSVFELGNPKPESAWPKAPAVRTVHRPLGEWNTADSAT